MNEQIKIFENPQFGKIRTSGTPDEPLFCVADVCKALGYTNGRKAVDDHVDNPDVTKRYVWVVTGKKADGTDAVRESEATFITESGLYALIFGSKLESAKEFKRWVTSEVLPSIRKHGAYMTDDIIERTLTDPDYLIRLATELKNEKQKRLAAEQTVEKQTKQLTEQKPKVEFYDAAMSSKDTKTLQEVAKTINIPNVGRTIVFRVLREKKILDSKNQPNQKYVNDGYFKLIQVTKLIKGKIHLFTQTVVFPSGIEFVRNTVLHYLSEKRNRDNGLQQLSLFDNI